MAAQLADALDFAAAASVPRRAASARRAASPDDSPRGPRRGARARTRRRGGAGAPALHGARTDRRRRRDRRADVFSLAALAYELSGAAGCPEPARRPPSPDRPPGADLPELREVFACTLADDMSDRFATATEFAPRSPALRRPAREGEPHGRGGTRRRGRLPRRCCRSNERRARGARRSARRPSLARRSWRLVLASKPFFETPSKPMRRLQSARLHAPRLSNWGTALGRADPWSPMVLFETRRASRIP